eukprot:s467_g15.t1
MGGIKIFQHPLVAAIWMARVERLVDQVWSPRSPRIPPSSRTRPEGVALTSLDPRVRRMIGGAKKAPPKVTHPLAKLQTLETSATTCLPKQPLGGPAKNATGVDKLRQLGGRNVPTAMVLALVPQAEVTSSFVPSATVKVKRSVGLPSNAPSAKGVDEGLPRVQKLLPRWSAKLKRRKQLHLLQDRRFEETASTPMRRQRRATKRTPGQSRRSKAPKKSLPQSRRSRRSRLVRAFANLDQSLSSGSAGSADRARATTAKSKAARAARSRSPRRDERPPLPRSPRRAAKVEPQTEKESEPTDFDEEGEEEEEDFKPPTEAHRDRRGGDDRPPEPEGPPPGRPAPKRTLERPEGRGRERNEERSQRREYKPHHPKRRRRGGAKHQKRHKDLENPFRRSHRKIRKDLLELAPSLEAGLERRY